MEELRIEMVTSAQSILFFILGGLDDVLHPNLFTSDLPDTAECHSVMST